MILFFQFWELISEEHGVAADGSYEGNDSLQLEKINVYFNEVLGNRKISNKIIHLKKLAYQKYS